MPAPYSTVADLDAYSRIDNDTLVPEVKFEDAEKVAAIAQADARIDYVMKAWETFFTGLTLTSVQALVNEISIYYALYILFDKKAKIVMLMNDDNNNFATGDLNADSPDSTKKSFYIQYQALSQIYKQKADELIATVVPPGSDSVRTIFDLQVNDVPDAFDE
ncbi:MAG: hypothetical protein U9Q67_02660 [Patescibacteria group bacterium]|nr:hypothetical protein [Patescibacteria group bacterium]